MRNDWASAVTSEGVAFQLTRATSLPLMLSGSLFPVDTPFQTHSYPHLLKTITRIWDEKDRKIFKMRNWKHSLSAWLLNKIPTHIESQIFRIWVTASPLHCQPFLFLCFAARKEASTVCGRRYKPVNRFFSHSLPPEGEFPLLQNGQSAWRLPY